MVQRSIDVRVVVADGDRQRSAALAAALREAQCWVVECPDGPRLAEVLDAHARARRALDAIVVDGFLTSGGVVELNRLGVFDAGALVIVTLAPKHSAFARIARAAGAALVLEEPDDPSELVRAVRHLVDRERRWSGEWISTGALARPEWPSDQDEKR